LSLGTARAEAKWKHGEAWVGCEEGWMKWKTCLGEIECKYQIKFKNMEEKSKKGWNEKTLTL
jgi:hypothetical protein